MKSIKLLALPILATALVVTGCASRKPSATIEAGQNPNGSTTVNTQGLSEDAALNA
jgi:peptidoglycan-associated lipoprotein